VLGKDRLAIEATELLETIRRIEARGASMRASVSWLSSEIFRYAIVDLLFKAHPAPICGCPAADQRRAFRQHHGSREVSRTARAIDRLEAADHAMRAPTRPLTFVRPGELRTAEWEHVDDRRRRMADSG